MDALDQGFRFGDLCIAPLTGEITGRGGQATLDPKVMAVLVVMARHAGQVVSRDELLRRVWPGAIVTDDAVNRCFYELRRQMSLAGGDESYRAKIETLPKRGYRLNETVTPLAPTDTLRKAASSSRRNRVAAWTGGLVILAAGGLAALLLLRQTAPRSIAVLPFTDMSETQDQQYLSDGIAEEIIDRLAGAGTLRVIARTSSFSFRDRPAEIPEIADHLGVSHVLEGSLRRSGDRIRITAQLVEGDGAAHVWSQTYDRTLGELFAVQDDIASAVAAALQAELVPATARHRAPVHATAYENFLQGEFFYNRRSPGDIARAVRHYASAVELDPQYARAWAALSGAYGLMWWTEGQDPVTWRRRQGDAAMRAVALDPELAAAQFRLASYYFDVSNRRKAVEHMRRAQILDRTRRQPSPEALMLPSEWDIELELADKGDEVRRDPLSASKRKNLAVFLFAAGRLEEAIAEFRKAQELNPGGWEETLEIARVLIAQGRYPESHAAIAELAEGPHRDYAVALLYRDRSHRVEAEAALARLAAQTGDHMHHIRIAEAYALRGMTDAAFDALVQARDALTRDESILTRYWFLQREFFVAPFLEPLRADPRWTVLTGIPEADSAEELIRAIWPEPQQTAAQ